MSLLVFSILNLVLSVCVELPMLEAILLTCSSRLFALMIKPVLVEDITFSVASAYLHVPSSKYPLGLKEELIRF